MENKYRIIEEIDTDKHPWEDREHIEVTKGEFFWIQEASHLFLWCYMPYRNIGNAKTLDEAKAYLRKYKRENIEEVVRYEEEG